MQAWCNNILQFKLIAVRCYLTQVLTPINFSDRNYCQRVARYGTLKHHGKVCPSKWLSREDVEAARAYVAGLAKVLATKGI